MTGSPNGQLKVWSYNSGECLKTLDKGYHLTASIAATDVLYIGNKREVTRARFVSVNQNKYVTTRKISASGKVYICFIVYYRYIVAVGWDKKPTVFPVSC